MGIGLYLYPSLGCRVQAPRVHPVPGVTPAGLSPMFRHGLCPSYDCRQLLHLNSTRKPWQVYQILQEKSCFPPVPQNSGG